MYLFISHSSKDAEAASGICDALERNGNDCFIAPRNIRSGYVYAEEIMDGIERSGCMIVVLSANANESPHVLREIERAVSKAIPIIIYKLEDVKLTKSMEYFLMAHQWMDAGADTDYRKLVECVKNLEQSQETQQTQAGFTEPSGAKGKGRKPGRAVVYGAVMAAAALICFGVYRLTAADFAGAAPKTGGNDEAFIAESNPPVENEAVTGGDTADEYKSATESNAPVENKAIMESSAPDKDKNIAESGTADEDKNITGSGTASKAKNITGGSIPGEDKNITGGSAPEKDKSAAGSSAPEKDKSPTGGSTAGREKGKGKKAAVKVGDTVRFGNYNGQAVEWRVLKVSDDGREGVLVSKHILTMKAFDAPESGKYNYDGKAYFGFQTSEADTDMELQAKVRGSSDWSTSNIRTWLNSEKEVVRYADQQPIASAMSEMKNGYNNEAGFLNGFTNEELEAIKEVQIKTNGNALSGREKVITRDRVYLLSREELSWFDDAGISKLAAPTDAAVKQDKTKWYQSYSLDFGLKDYYWWLRDPVEDAASRCYIVGNGYTEELIYDRSVGVEGFGIRPAVTVKLENSSIVLEQ